MARRPFPLSAYLAYARSRQSLSSQGGSPAPRPGGPLIWMHADSPDAARALGALASRLTANRGEVAALLTGLPAGVTCGTVLTATLPEDIPADVRAFVDHWRPSVAITTGQALRPVLLHRLKETRAKLAHVGARDDAFTTPAPVWVPDPGPATLALYDRIFAENDAALRRLRRLGLSDEVLRPGGVLSETAPPLDCSDRLHQELTAALSGRPVWLAARVRGSEAGDILRAHQRAVRLAHRLLLILVPESPGDAVETTAEARASGMRLSHWEAGETPDENTQVLVTENTAELGLWYRLSPVAFLGGSLLPGHGGTDPLEAAAHGTAMLYGPNVGRHLSAYSRLVDAGAARIVRDFDSLGSAVIQLMAPDRAAAMAHAGWDVVSQGAALTDEVISLACDWLDEGQAA
ncbi:3-deoxy-D-manno-octulosonic acid transferase [Salipiger sp.]|uniref:3-deoxy-D-manno-octulosonic acid transferase n=1 Tax=Salipiger sp. TaxID=2078585 RepID=UPI003A98233E